MPRCRSDHNAHQDRLPVILHCRLLLPLSLLASPVAAQQPTAIQPPVPSPVRGDPAAGPAPAVPARGRGVQDRAELAAFLDGVMIANLRDKHVAGATVAVVKDGALFYAKGYGYADIARRAPVDAERTLFRIGSTSKLFTWTAVMQLVEQGKLDLNADVNRYLDFQIPRTYPQPITLRHVMTHTPGFEEDGRDLITDDSTRIVPLGRWLATHVPGRVRPPGTYASYSNYATALAGYIVQRVSGVPFDDYVERHILTPLGMSQTTTRQPLPARFDRAMSQGYKWGGGAYAPQKFEIVLPAPAGSMSSSAADMARFMIAHLNGGAYDGRRILADSTAASMHARTFAHDPRIPGFALGFYEQSSHGLRIIGHGGDTQWFHTDLALIPEERLGVFVSYNTSTGGELSFGTFLTQFLDHYYPMPATAVALAPGAVAEAERVAGEYEFNRRSYTTFQKAIGLAGNVRISADSGRLVMQSPLGAARFVPIGPLLYREELGAGLLAFRAEKDGRVTRGFLGAAPMMAMERVPFTRSAQLHWVLLGLGALVFVGILLAAVGRFVRRRFGEVRRDDVLPGRWLLVTASLLELAFLAAVGAILGASGGLLQGPLTSLKLALALPIIAALCILGASYVAARQWRLGAGTRGARLRYSAAVLVAVLFTWSLGQWNLFGWYM